MDSIAATKRAGFLLEKNGRKTNLNKEDITGVHWLIPGKKGKSNNKWRLYV
jgi:predicted methyltransferase